jgi:type II secretory pathway component PulK
MTPVVQERHSFRERTAAVRAPEKPTPRTSEDGFALLVVLIVLMIVAVVATDLAQRARIQSFLASNARNDLAVAEAARGWVEVVKARLLFDLKENNVDAEGDVWSEDEILQAEVGDVSLEVLVEDESGKFPIARLMHSDKTVKKLARQQFVRLLVSFRQDTDRSLSESEADQLLDDLVEYLKREEEGDFPVADAGKDAPAMLTMDELRYVKGFHDPDDSDARILYDEFREESEEELEESEEVEPIPGLIRFVTLSSEGRININTAPVEVLRCLFKNESDWDKAEAIVAYRTGEGATDTSSLEDSEFSPFESIEDLTKIDGIDAKTLSENSIGDGVVTVSSNVFSITVFARRENLTRQFRTIVKRNPQGFTTLLHEERKDPRHAPVEEEEEDEES